MARTTVEVAVDLEVITCSCGAVYGLPVAWVRDLRRNHQIWYCPNGHQRYFPPGTSEEEKLRQQLASAQGNANYYQERSGRLERSLSAQRGVKTRILNRVKSGLCPFCGRGFAELALHVQDNHADQVTAQTEGDGAAEVVE